MAPLNWATYLERAVGKGHPTLSDTVNRALRQLLSESGYDPDATTFPGLAGPVANVKAYGIAVGTGGDDSAAIQAAINTGRAVFFPDGTYLANNLSQSTNQQRLFALGSAQIIKNANGPILASTGDTVQCINLQFRGEAATPVFTGDNVTFSGANCALVNCGSRWAFGRAVKATGGHFQIIGTNDIYQTADQTATGYDIEIGLSGVATLYHKLLGVYSSQGSGSGAGGILFVDCGGQTIEGGQFGKLNISVGSGPPAGANGGMYIGNRVLGNVDVGISGANFSANQFGAIVFTIGASVTGCSVDESNSFQAGATLINNGGGSCPIIRSVGASGNIELKFGQDTSAAILKITPSSSPRFEFPWDVVVPNTRAFKVSQAGGSDGVSLSQNAGGDVFLSNPVTDKTISHQTTGTGSGARHQFATNGGANVKMCIDNNGIIVGPSGSPQLRSGSGSPEGAVTAPVGSLYVRTDGGAATSLYVKESGAGNTGWVAK